MLSASRTGSRILPPLPTSSYRTSGHVPYWATIRSARIGYFLLSRSFPPSNNVLRASRTFGPLVWKQLLKAAISSFDYTAPHSLSPSWLDLPFQRWPTPCTARLLQLLLPRPGGASPRLRTGRRDLHACTLVCLICPDISSIVYMGRGLWRAAEKKRIAVACQTKLFTARMCSNGQKLFKLQSPGSYSRSRSHACLSAWTRAHHVAANPPRITTLSLYHLTNSCWSNTSPDSNRGLSFAPAASAHMAQRSERMSPYPPPQGTCGL